MSKQVITLSDRAAKRVKEIISQAKEPIFGFNRLSSSNSTEVYLKDIV